MNIVDILKPDILLLAGVVALYSVVQSVFGIGLLVFGTPTLLLLGYSFDSTLACLLPCSIVLSSAQVINGWDEIGELKTMVPIYVLPFVAIGLFYILAVEKSFSIKWLVGLMMVLTGIIRVSKRFNGFLHGFFLVHLRPALILMGLSHGATNLGGGPLTIIMNSIFNKKETVRANIAYGYLLMALTQVGVMLIAKPKNFGTQTIILPIISIVTYLLIGNRIFTASRQAVYQYLMTMLIIVFGLCLVLVR